MTSNSDESEIIQFWAAVYKVQTLATDSGIRITLDLPETAIAQAAYFMDWQRRAVPVWIECKTERNNGMEKRTNRKSKRKTAQE